MLELCWGKNCADRFSIVENFFFKIYSNCVAFWLEKNKNTGPLFVGERNVQKGRGGGGVIQWDGLEG